MKTSVLVTGDRYELSGAILLYRQTTHSYQAKSSNALATIHEVEGSEGRPILKAGRPMTEVDFGLLVKQLAVKDRPQVEWQDHSVLAKGLGRTIWWTPPMRRAMFFQMSKHNAKSFKGQGMCPVPGMIWMSLKDDLYVYAFAGKGTPDQQTALYQAPLMNIWASGKVCHGNATAPAEEKRGEAKEWEKFLFGSRFTHPNFTEKDRLIKGANPVDFWKKMVNKPTVNFPDKKLVDVGLVIADLLAPDVISRLSEMTATGEF